MGHDFGYGRMIHRGALSWETRGFKLVEWIPGKMAVKGMVKGSHSADSTTFADGRRRAKGCQREPVHRGTHSECERLEIPLLSVFVGDLAVCPLLVKG